jgi:hypothetical protein
MSGDIFPRATRSALQSQARISGVVLEHWQGLTFPGRLKNHLQEVARGELATGMSRTFGVTVVGGLVCTVLVGDDL